ncbi:UDP-N-acetylmuramoyl-L-alanyl-D-glutamate--2,6-diaminopimelate ligase [Halomonas qaidamensis]|uniref:UDP-N-acetylmuramoyl-L-alanyl-D-glutamate--2,6-diaminopimelate ligase n=1 Tax=Halomonas qaidamensis TaxID=2866211 RepID=A0ABY6JKM5_9GAMM|nr:UDP-N-acetylmuramoyl-L-alanyl-D-glutamate--2,6-diaminopimelate ligase [Halomonas qaidamensis]UYV17841.1 UDP-N-acetylmuramoyl-L-alanyl-D-glutamate--2,6-diaminopimelate ligase [Halomonas qaidamensis]
MKLTPERLWVALKQVWPNAVLPEPMPILPEQLRLVTDTRKLAMGDVFVAIPGSQRDGYEFVDQALAAGASLVLAHAKEGRVTLEGGILYLPHLSIRLGELGRALFGVPNDLQVIGVTGTNGKSSVTHYIAALSELLGQPAGVIGTLGVGRLGQLVDTGLTTPGSLAMQEILADLAHQGVTRVALEASSHALEQRRLDAVNVTAGVFTNLTRDHLDYHGSMMAYAAAKAKLFRRSELVLAVVNADDPLARLMLAGCDSGVRVLAVGSDEAVTLRVLDWHPHEHGQQALIATPEGEKALNLSLMGRFNLDNVLLAMSVLYGLGEPLDQLFELAAELEPVPGRMALYREANAPSVVIDYAHTPDALSNALDALKEHLGSTGKLWCLFGCGGERDAGKRTEMAAVAERRADYVIVTDDNPRNESAEQIRQQIVSGFSAAAEFMEIGDRSQAIWHAVQHADTQDVILVAGKGHESYQHIGGVRHDYQDSEQVLKAFKLRAVM